ncbi:MAG: hypothetical protein GC154_04685 [bacterium]|nr:hypothetical protein [bacterium]
MKLEPHVIGNIGMYYACYRLSCMGWNVMPTARNARRVDIIAYNKNASKYIGIQVKTLSKQSPVPLGTSLEKIMGDYWLIINNVAKTPNSFVMEPREVKIRAHRGEKNGRLSHWLQRPAYDLPEFKEAWHRIGRGDELESAL